VQPRPRRVPIPIVMRTGGWCLAACALFVAGCTGGSSDRSNDATAAETAAFCGRVNGVEGTEPFPGLEHARTRADADAIVDGGFAGLRPVRPLAPASVAGRADRYVAPFEEFAALMRESNYDPDPRDYADLQSRTTTARLDFAAATEQICASNTPA